MTDKEQIELYLKDLPSKWGKQLTTLLCEIKASKQVPLCSEVKSCETLTSLSPFTTVGSVISTTYKDENGVSFIRSFDVAQIVNSSIDDLNANCLTDPTTWSNMTFAERIQLLIDSRCACCTAPEEGDSIFTEQFTIQFI